MSGRRQRADNHLRVVGERCGDPGGLARAEPPPNNLPAETSSFIGRERELAEARDLLAGTRLLTLTGAGGGGKTRLALRLARAAAATGFPDGVWWVALASLSDLRLVPQAVAKAIGVRETPGRWLVELVAEHLGSAEALLVLDNCEHLAEACAALSGSLLGSCPNLKVLSTSRETLGVSGETVWVVPPLSVPDAGLENDPEAVLRHDSARLFVERASAASGAFALTEENAGIVAELCERLDGIPLAIELAAARTRVLSVAQIISRLDDRFRLLVGGGRSALPQHRTLRATMDWSHDLLPEEERVLLRRLSAFSGGFTLEAAEEVCSGGVIEREGVLDVLSGLVDKSLVSVGRSDEEARYRLLETVRQYATEKLNESGEEAEVRGRHALMFQVLAEEAEPAMMGPEQAAWLERLETEHDNLRAALGWLKGEGEAERGLRLAGALPRFWWVRGHLTEGRVQLEALLDLPGAFGKMAVRAKALYGLGVMVYRHGDYAAGDQSVARSSFEESLAIYRGLGDGPRAAAALRELGRVSVEVGEWATARSFLEESLAIERQSGSEHGFALTLFTLGLMTLLKGDYVSARPFFEESSEIFRQLGDKYYINGCLYFLGCTDCERGDYATARSRFAEIPKTASMLQHLWSAPFVLDGFARVAAGEGQVARALHLAGAATALRQTIGISLGPGWQAHFTRCLEPVQSALDEEAGAAAWEVGRAMTLEHAIAYALEKSEMPHEEAQGSPARSAGGLLSAREIEVLGLVAEGLTDAQIAQRLYLSRHTVGNHLRSVYRKLDARGRAAAVKRAGELGLL